MNKILFQKRMKKNFKAKEGTQKIPKIKKVKNMKEYKISKTIKNKLMKKNQMKIINLINKEILSKI